MTSSFSFLDYEHWTATHRMHCKEAEVHWSRSFRNKFRRISVFWLYFLSDLQRYVPKLYDWYTCAASPTIVQKFVLMPTNQRIVWIVWGISFLGKWLHDNVRVLYEWCTYTLRCWVGQFPKLSKLIERPILILFFRFFVCNHIKSYNLKAFARL